MIEDKGSRLEIDEMTLADLEKFKAAIAAFCGSALPAFDRWFRRERKREIPAHVLMTAVSHVIAELATYTATRIEGDKTVIVNELIQGAEDLLNGRDLEAEARRFEAEALAKARPAGRA